MRSMNRLQDAKRATVLNLLIEGMSMRAVARVVGVSSNTVAKLLVDARSRGQLLDLDRYLLVPSWRIGDDRRSVRVSQIGTGQVRVTQGRTSQIGTRQVRNRQVCTEQGCAP